MVGKYIGQRRIKSLENYNDMAFLVSFDDGTHQLVSKLIIERIVTPKAVTASDLRNARILVIAEVVLQNLNDYNMELGELEQLCQTLKLSVEDSAYRANNILWGVEYKTMMDVDKVLKDKKVTLEEMLKDPNA